MTLAFGRSITIDEECTACGACLMTCPERALLASPRRPAILVDRCTACLACVEVCPRDAIHVVAGDLPPAAAGAGR